MIRQSNRREFLQKAFQSGLALSGAVFSYSLTALSDRPKPLQKAIPSSGEWLPVIGMGTSRTFDVDSDPNALVDLGKVLQVFFEKGGRVIDTSPMYGSAEAVLGRLFASPSHPNDLFVATKVWTEGRQNGIDQMHQSMGRMQVRRFDLMQIHNLVDWRTHLETLKAWKAEGKIRYIGITTSHGRDHGELEAILKKHRFDFVQISYNLEEREAEKRLLPVARERDIAVLVNRPFQRGELFRKTQNAILPGWASEIGCETRAQFFLKYVISHPAVTCALPATANVHHMRDNMGANFGPLPDLAMRSEMEAWFGKF